MADQVLHLKENNGESADLHRNIISKCFLVEAEMLNSTTPKHRAEEIYKHLMNPPPNGEQGIKLLYVTVGFCTIQGETNIKSVS